MNMVNELSIEKAMDYSSNAEKLKEILKGYEFNYTNIGYRPYFDGDEESRTVLNITIKNLNTEGNREISFNFGCSINDSEILNYQEVFGNESKFHAENVKRFKPLTFANSKGLQLLLNYSVKKHQRLKNEILNDLLYSILSTVKSEFYCEPSFTDFCDEFGYEEDSRKAFSLWQKCLDQSEKLNTIFNEEDLEYFPD